jgi:hypothetical protein
MRATSRRWMKPPGTRQWPGRSCFVGYPRRHSRPLRRGNHGVRRGKKGRGGGPIGVLTRGVSAPRPSGPLGLRKRVYARFRAVAAERASAGARGAGPAGPRAPGRPQEPGANLINPSPADLRNSDPESHQLRSEPEAKALIRRSDDRPRTPSGRRGRKPTPRALICGLSNRETRATPRARIASATMSDKATLSDIPTPRQAGRISCALDVTKRLRGFMLAR